MNNIINGVQRKGYRELLRKATFSYSMLLIALSVFSAVHIYKFIQYKRMNSIGANFCLQFIENVPILERFFISLSDDRQFVPYNQQFTKNIRISIKAPTVAVTLGNLMID